jgi:septum formation protein
MVILASASPRRKKLMKELVPSFDIIVPEIDESLSFLNHKGVKDIVHDIAFRKCQKISKDHPHDLVIAADTVVVIENEIIGKPKDKEDAYKMLKKLSGKTHYVYTAYVISKEDKTVSNVAETEVVFNDLSDDLINRYIATGSPLDKAGAYGYQDNDQYPLVKKINGSITNVIGFPVEDIKEDLKKFSL